MAGTQRGKGKGRTLRASLVGFNFADNNGKPRAVWKKPRQSVDFLFRGMNEKCGKHTQ